MTRPTAASLFALLLLAGCAGGSVVPSGAAPPVQPAGAAGTQLEPYQIPIVTDPAVEAAQTAAGRQTENAYGGVPGSLPNLLPSLVNGACQATSGSGSVQSLAGVRQTQNAYGGVPGAQMSVSCAAASTASSSARAVLGSRQPLNAYGGVPATASIIDAANFPEGSQVNLAIVAVNAMSGGVAYPIVQFAAPVVINVLNYQSQALALGSATIPAIAYDGVQYVIDPSQSSVVTNGQSYPMVFGTFANRSFVPSGGGLAALYFAAPVNAATAAPNFVVDFNTGQWINLSGGIAQVGPQWAGTVWGQSAVIAGTIVNAAGQPVSGATVSAVSPGGAVVQATLSRFDGTFQLHAIPSGSYSLVIYNTYAPPTTDFTLTASGNDPVGTSIAGPSITVPSGYRINVGSIQD